MAFIIGLLTLVMVLDCLIVILLVLIQLPKKDAGAGLAFGGGATDALFGAGSGTVLTKKNNKVRRHRFFRHGADPVDSAEQLSPGSRHRTLQASAGPGAAVERAFGPGSTGDLTGIEHGPVSWHEQPFERADAGGHKRAVSEAQSCASPGKSSC